MKKKSLILLTIFLAGKILYAQDSQIAGTAPSQPDLPKKIEKDPRKRSGDHLMVQYGYCNWTGKPDSVVTSGFSRFFNIYLMYNMPFKKAPHLGWAIGGGIGSSNIFLNGSYADVKANSNTLPINTLNGKPHFKKYKLTETFLEVPVELRYYSKPENSDRSWKGALGAKLGFLLKSYTKGKDYLDEKGNSVYGTSYIEKESSTKFFNLFKMAATARVGYGFLSVNAEYNILNVLKLGAGAPMNLWEIGLTVSGL